MLSQDQLLEAITEAIRQQRRHGIRREYEPRFPTLFDLSYILYKAETGEIELELIDEGLKRKFVLAVYEV